MLNAPFADKKSNPALKNLENTEQQLTLNLLQQVLKQWRRKHLQQQLLLFLPIILIVLVVFLFCFSLTRFSTAFNEMTAIAAIMLFVLGILIKLALIKRNKSYNNITLKNLIVHLNSRFETLEQSAQLILLEQDKLSNLEKLQQNKVLARLSDILQQQSQTHYAQLTPKFAKRKFILRNILLFISLMVFIILTQFTLIDNALSLLKPADQNIHVINDKNQSEQNNTVLKLLSTKVTVIPPSYSIAEGEPAEFTSKILNIDTLVGSKVRWRLTFSEQNADIFLFFSNGEHHQLVKQDDGSLQFELILHKSTVYHLASKDKVTGVVEAISDIYRINLMPDNAPKIRFISPKSTVTEYGKNTVPKLFAEVQISDDFALTDIHIKASIAKGSGEGVKFRDQSFTFDSDAMVNAKQHYYKSWSIEALAMEPGDELYFSIVATDNREPEHQQTRSATKIIRWLDEDQTGISADGILIDFMPEYFKSQRQIIIETLELIEDNIDLDRKSFNEKSELLGIAQSALKEKYGQYLGDEFEKQENEGDTFDENHHDLDHDKPKIHIHDEQGGSANAVISANKTAVPSESSGHLHEHNTANNTNGSLDSARMELINKYGHNHEDSDVGVMTSQDPRALMKKSLANMWQAELHLMLSEPEQALPFEQQALKLLNLARKAERIYVKRLGFEPPPVTEKRRYQGDQADILANSMLVSRFNLEQLSNQTLVVFRQFLQLLNKFNQPLVPTKHIPNIAELQNEKATNKRNYSKLKPQLSADELALVKLTKLALEKLIDDRPALVELLVVIEQVLLEQRLNLSQCNQCIILLTGKITQLLPNPTASPNRKLQDFEEHQPLVEQYSQFLEGSL